MHKALTVFVEHRAEGGPQVTSHNAVLPLLVSTTHSRLQQLRDIRDSSFHRLDSVRQSSLSPDLPHLTSVLLQPDSLIAAFNGSLSAGGELYYSRSSSDQDTQGRRFFWRRISLVEIAYCRWELGFGNREGNNA